MRAAEGGVMGALLEQLEAEERAISARRRRLHNRIATSPDTTGSWALEEQEVSRKRRELHRQIDLLLSRPDEPNVAEQTSATLSS